MASTWLYCFVVCRVVVVVGCCRGLLCPRRRLSIDRRLFGLWSRQWRMSTTAYVCRLSRRERKKERKTMFNSPPRLDLNGRAISSFLPFCLFVIICCDLFLFLCAIYSLRVPSGSSCLSESLASPRPSLSSRLNWTGLNWVEHINSSRTNEPWVPPSSSSSSFIKYSMRLLGPSIVYAHIGRPRQFVLYNYSPVGRCLTRKWHVVQIKRRASTVDPSRPVPTRPDSMRTLWLTTAASSTVLLLFFFFLHLI